MKTCSARGIKANQPHMASIIDAADMPLSRFSYGDTGDAQRAAGVPSNAENIKVMVRREKVARIRNDHLD